MEKRFMSGEAFLVFKLLLLQAAVKVSDRIFPSVSGFLRKVNSKVNRQKTPTYWLSIEDKQPRICPIKIASKIRSAASPPSPLTGHDRLPNYEVGWGFDTPIR
jgi:hypothetical protein